MDVTDFGRYGTLSLLRRQENEGIVASYPIDDPEVTIGRDPTCNIRLYYPAVSAMHCKIVVDEENKALLVILGTNGVLIDGCPVYPAPAHSAPTTVPLPNHSTIEIHKKRWRFTYPPKHLRPALAALPPTPVATPGHRRKALRMSMIQSAQVFSPRPFSDPMENLRILQSPLKAQFRPQDDDEEEPEQGDQGDGEEIVLVESDYPRVVESEKDLVVLDHMTVTDPPEPALPASPALRMPLPVQAWAPPRTPVQRPPRASLHKAVLIRSAKRAVMRQEMHEEEMEVEEVEETIAGGLDEKMDSVEEEEEEHEDDEVETKQSDRVTQMSGWRKSLEAVKGSLGWALRAASLEPQPAEPSGAVHGTEHDEDTNATEHNKDNYEQDEEASHEDEDDENNEQAQEYPVEVEVEVEQIGTVPQPGPSTPSLKTSIRPLGRFMTPQAGSSSQPFRNRPHSRLSLGGFGSAGLSKSVSGPSGSSGPRRVRVIEPWKVTDIVVPLQEDKIKEEDEEVKGEKEDVDMEVVADADGDIKLELNASPVRKREKVSEEEKRAIRDRRRSALRTPDTFFNGQVPGSRRTTLLPPSTPLIPALFPSLQQNAADVGYTTPIASSSASGVSAQLQSDYSIPVKTEDGTSEDTDVLFARMRQMVEGVKRRQSMEVSAERRRVSVSPKKRSGFSLLARDQDIPQGVRGDDAAMNVIQEGEGQEDVMDEDHEEQEGEKENVQDQALTEDVEMQDADEHEVREIPAGPPGLRLPPQTPRMSDLRHVFAKPAGPSTPKYTGMRELFKEGAAAVPETPKMDGVREMFLRGKNKDGLHEAALDGVGELLATPAGWKAARTADASTEAEPDEGEANVPSRRAPVRSIASRFARGRTVGSIPPPRRTTPRSAATAKATPASDLPSVQEDAVAPEASESVEPQGSRVARRTRTRTTETEQEGASVTRPSATRQTRTTVEASDSQVPAKASRSSARKKAGTDVSEDEAAPAAAQVVKRTRKAADATASITTAEETPASTSATTARRTRASSRTPSVEPPAAKSSTRRSAKAKPIDMSDDESNDPLDSIAEGQEPAAAPPAARVRRTARSKIPVKEETSDSPAIPAAGNAEAAPAATRARKTPARAVTATATKTTTRTRAAAASAAKKAAAGEQSGKVTPSAGDEGEDHGDKENTPEPEDDSTAGSAAAKGRAGATSKLPVGARVKATRAGTRGRATPGAEDAAGVETEAAGAKSVTRAGRARAAAARR